MITTVEETGSTNADLIAAAGVGALEGVWLRARRQSAGRGRLGRDWLSPEGNLFASTIVRLRPSDPSPAGLGLVAAVALEETARLYLGEECQLELKWPNDLMLAFGKLSGILLERSGDAVIIGFGVNISHAPTIPGRVTAYMAQVVTPPDAAIVLDTLAEIFARWLARWRVEGLAAVRVRWMERAHAVGTALTISGDQPVTGLFDGLEEDGALRLRLADGSSRVIHAGDASLASGD